MLLKVTCSEGGGGIDMTGGGLLIWKAVGSLWHFGFIFLPSLKALPGQHGLVG